MEDKTMARKTYVGYDLGDGETITDLVTLESGRSSLKPIDTCPLKKGHSKADYRKIA